MTQDELERLTAAFEAVSLRGVGREMRKQWKEFQRMVVLPGEPLVPNKYGNIDSVVMSGPDELTFTVKIRSEDATIMDVDVLIFSSLDVRMTIKSLGLSLTAHLRTWTPEQVETLFSEGLDVAKVLCS